VALVKIQDVIQKIKAERTEGMLQVIEHLPSKCKGLEFKTQYHQKRKTNCNFSVNI
jgi:hypothetical protein